MKLFRAFSVRVVVVFSLSFGASQPLMLLAQDDWATAYRELNTDYKEQTVPSPQKGSKKQEIEPINPWGPSGSSNEEIEKISGEIGFLGTQDRAAIARGAAQTAAVMAEALRLMTIFSSKLAVLGKSGVLYTGTFGKWMVENSDKIFSFMQLLLLLFIARTMYKVKQDPGGYLLWGAKGAGNALLNAGWGILSGFGTAVSSMAS